MKDDETMRFDLQDVTKIETKEILEDVYHSLKKRGYNPINQLVGYLISGDPGYISNYQDARRKIQQLDRAKIVEVLLSHFME